MYACLISIKWLFCILCVRKCLKVQDGTPKRNNRHHKEAWLVELWDSSGEDGVWSLRFFKPFNDWEVERLLLTIREGGLILIWKIECYGKRLRMRFLS